MNIIRNLLGGKSKAADRDRLAELLAQRQTHDRAADQAAAAFSAASSLSPRGRLLRRQQEQHRRLAARAEFAHAVALVHSLLPRLAVEAENRLAAAVLARDAAAQRRDKAHREMQPLQQRVAELQAHTESTARDLAAELEAARTRLAEATASSDNAAAAAAAAALRDAQARRRLHDDEAEVASVQMQALHTRIAELNKAAEQATADHDRADGEALAMQREQGLQRADAAALEMITRLVDCAVAEAGQRNTHGAWRYGVVDGLLSCWVGWSALLREALGQEHHAIYGARNAAQIGHFIAQLVPGGDEDVLQLDPLTLPGDRGGETVAEAA